MYLDEKDFPRLKDAKPADFFDNTFAGFAKVAKTGAIDSAGHGVVTPTVQ
jgi:hypothetical protein